MVGKVLRRYGRWTVPGALLLLLAAFGCNSSGAAAPDASPTAGLAAGAVAQVNQATASPAALTGRATPTPSPPPPTPSATLAPIGTATPSRAPISTPTPTVSPTATPTASATPTPVLRRLTSDGCCTQPFWSPDSRQVLFIDKPGPAAPLGIWGVDTTRPGAAPELMTERIAFYTADLSYVVTREQGATIVERLNGPLGETVLERWTVPSGGRSVSISPSRSRVAWQVSDQNLPSERQVTQVWVANLDGSDAQLVATLPRGGLTGWLADDTLLLSGRESLESLETVVYSLSLTDGAQVELARAERPRGTSLSPDGRWLMYYVSLSDDPAENGIWLVRTDGTERRELDRDLFGAYQWRDAQRLLFIPFRPEAVYHELWELDAETGEVRRLTDADVTPFKIANGDWTVSPDGRYVAFVESADRNIWILTVAD